MSKYVSVEIFLNKKQILGKINNDTFGVFVAYEWKKQIDDFTPQRDGFLIGKRGVVVIEPFAITYDSPYAHRLYDSQDFDFSQELSKQATDHWDQKAANAGRDVSLLRIINKALKKGHISY